MIPIYKIFKKNNPIYFFFQINILKQMNFLNKNNRNMKQKIKKMKFKAYVNLFI